MGMESLAELYYKDRAHYQEAYQMRFTSPYTIHLGFETKGGPAFFTQTPEIIGLLTKILRTDREVAHLRSFLPGAAVEQFTRRCLIDEIVLTNSMEGVHSTRREIGEILEDLESRGRERRFFGLVQKYKMLMTEEEIPLKHCADIRAVYDALVLAEVREEDAKNVPDGKYFRKGPVSIYSPTQKELHRGTWPEELIIQQMEQALAFLADDSQEILYRIGIFHYLLEYIHPFYDGNGRLGRFLCSYLLSRELVPVTAYRISYTIKERVGEYNRAFSTCNQPRNRGDLTPFLWMFLDVVRESVENLRNAFQEGRLRLEACREKLPALSRGDDTLQKIYFLLIQAALFAEYGASTKEILSHVGISHDTLKRKLDLIPPELLIKRKRGRENYYSLRIEQIEE